MGTAIGIAVAGSPGLPVGGRLGAGLGVVAGAGLLHEQVTSDLRRNRADWRLCTGALTEDDLAHVVCHPVSCLLQRIHVSILFRAGRPSTATSRCWHQDRLGSTHRFKVMQPAHLCCNPSIELKVDLSTSQLSAAGGRSWPDAHRGRCRRSPQSTGGSVCAVDRDELGSEASAPSWPREREVLPERTCAGVMSGSTMKESALRRTGMRCGYGPD
jgi:hypothetical protein